MTCDTISLYHQLTFPVETLVTEKYKIHFTFSLNLSCSNLPFHPLDNTNEVFMRQQQTASDNCIDASHLWTADAWWFRKNVPDLLYLGDHSTTPTKFLCTKWSLSSRVQLPTGNWHNWMVAGWQCYTVTVGNWPSPPCPHCLRLSALLFMQTLFPLDCGSHLSASQAQLCLFFWVAKSPFHPQHHPCQHHNLNWHESPWWLPIISSCSWVPATTGHPQPETAYQCCLIILPS